MAAATSEVDAIRREMAQIRTRLHQDMQGVVAGAEAASDWKHYVRLYPWAALGGAFAIGYFVIPRRRRSVTRTAEKAADAAIARVSSAVESLAPSKPHVKIEEPTKKEKKGLLATALGFAAPMIWKTVQGYALSYAENWIAQQTQAGGSGPAPSGPTPSGPPPSGPSTGGRPMPSWPGGVR